MKSSFIAQRYGVEIDLCREGKTQCPRCAHNGKDNSHNNLMVYGLDENGKHRGFFCWSCEFKMPSQQWLEDNGEIEEEEYEEIVGSHFDKEVNEKIAKQEREAYCDRIYSVLCKAERKNNRSDMAESLYDAGLRFVGEEK